MNHWQFERRPGHVTESRPWTFGWLAFAMAVGAVPCQAQPAIVIREKVVLEEGEAGAGQAGMAVVEFEFGEEMFDQWLYRTNDKGQSQRARFDRLLELTVENVDRACRLDAGQKAKLKLAGRRDVQSFVERVEVARTKFNALKKDQNAINAIMQEIQPLQQLLQRGLFADGSFFRKTLRTVLSKAQFAQQEREIRERLAFQHQTQVELFVAGLDDALGLLDDQREKLLRLLLAETRPVPAAAEYGYYLVACQLSRIPDEKVRPLLDESQWKILKQQAAQWLQLEDTLRQQGLLPAAEGEAKPAAAPLERATEETRP